MSRQNGHVVYQGKTVKLYVKAKWPSCMSQQNSQVVYHGKMANVTYVKMNA